MSTQYNSIQGPYDYIRTVSIALIEHENVADAIRPYIEDANVLELACGSGFYTHSFIRWGARSVTGVDISSAMIEANKQQAQNIKGGSSNDDSIKFIQADCSQPTLYQGGPFDIVFAAWLLNYAPDRNGLKDMFGNVALNLKPGGHFVSITLPPSSDPRASIVGECAARPRDEGGSGLLFYDILNDVTDGCYFRALGDTPVGNFHFDNYYLAAEAYEESAREAGLNGSWNWGVTWVPERFLRGEGPGGSSIKEISSYETVPNYGILVVGKEQLQ